VQLGVSWVYPNLLTFLASRTMMPSMLGHERLLYLWINSNTCTRVSSIDCPCSKQASMDTENSPADRMHDAAFLAGGAAPCQ